MFFKIQDNNIRNSIIYMRRHEHQYNDASATNQIIRFHRLSHIQYQLTFAAPSISLMTPKGSNDYP